MWTAWTFMLAFVLFWGFNLFSGIIDQLKIEQIELMNTRILNFLKIYKRRCHIHKSSFLTDDKKEAFVKHSDEIFAKIKPINIIEDFNKQSMEIKNIPNRLEQIQNFGLIMLVGKYLFFLLFLFTLISYGYTHRDEKFLLLFTI